MIAAILAAHWKKRGRPKPGTLHPLGCDAEDEIDLCEEAHFADCEEWARCPLCQSQDRLG